MWLLSVRKQAYWWYAFLLPGAIAILCSLSHRKEENAGKYYSVFSMPVNLSRFEFAKGIILVEKLLVSAIFLALLISISNIIAPATAVYSLLHSITGSIGIILASVWQIPLGQWWHYWSRRIGRTGRKWPRLHGGGKLRRYGPAEQLSYRRHQHLRVWNTKLLAEIKRSAACRRLDT